MIVVVFGDSVAYGAWDGEGGWVERLKQYLHRRAIKEDEYNLVYNLAISGETSSGILKRMETEADRRLEDGERSVMILQVGMNDSAIAPEGRPVVPLPVFGENVREILLRAQKLFDRTLVLGLFEVNEERSCPPPWARICYKNERIRRYDEILRTISADLGVWFVSLMGAIRVEDLSDGLHPNAQGHEKIFRRVLRELG